MGANFNKAKVERAYARWAPIYDLVFGAMFEDGRRARQRRAQGGGRHANIIGRNGGEF